MFIHFNLEFKKTDCISVHLNTLEFQSPKKQGKTQSPPLSLSEFRMSFFLRFLSVLFLPFGGNNSFFDRDCSLCDVLHYTMPR